MWSIPPPSLPGDVRRGPGMPPLWHYLGPLNGSLCPPHPVSTVVARGSGPLPESRTLVSKTRA
eukprot:6856300-Pyramimonas_sp.AAC.1